MQRSLRSLSILSVLSLATLPAFAQARVTDVPSPRDLTYPPLREVVLPQVQTFTLPNGLKVYLVEDHELPMVQGRAMLRAGGYLDPAGKVGLARLTGNVMRTGGVAGKTGDEMDEFLESRAAAVETDLGETEGSASFQCLKENLDPVLALFGNVLIHPAFADDKVDLAKVAVRSEIARRNDDPGQILRREYRKAIYGAHSPYARGPEYADMDAITVGDLKAFHAMWIRPQNAVLAVWGISTCQPACKTHANSGWLAKGGASCRPCPSPPTRVPEACATSNGWM